MEPLNVLPRVAASACIFKSDGRVLLVQRGKAPYAGRWSLPGGRIEPGEKAIAAAAREVAEETGLVSTLYGVAGINDIIVRDEGGQLTVHYVVVAFYGTADGIPVAASDAADARFVTLGELEPFALGRRVTGIIQDGWALYRERQTAGCST